MQSKINVLVDLIIKTQKYKAFEIDAETSTF